MRRWIPLLILLAVLAAGPSVYPYVSIFMRTVLDDETQGEARTTLGVGETDDPCFAGISAGTSANYSNIEADGTLVFHGDATVWDDLRFPASALRLAGAAPASSQAYRGGIVASFASTPNQYIYFNVQMPHEWKEGTDIHPHIHWVLPASGAGGGAENVKWDLTYSWANIGSVFPVESSQTVTIDVQNDVIHDHMLDDVGAAITGSGKTFSSMLICSLKRDTGVANDYASAAYLVEIDFHYEIDTIGSRQELSK